MKGLLFDCDAIIADWAFKSYRILPIVVDKAIGIVDDANEGKVVGAVLLHYSNRVNVNLGYYGENTLSLGIARTLAKYLLEDMKISRCTVVVRKRPKIMLKRLVKFGFVLEGSQRRYFGSIDCAKNTGVRFVLFKEQLEALAYEKRHLRKAA